MNIIAGKKTYIVAGLFGVLFAAQYLGVIDAEQASTYFKFLTAGGLASLAAGIKTKTPMEYGIAGLVAVLGAAQQLGYIDEQTSNTIYGFLTAGGLASIRNTLTKIQ